MISTYQNQVCIVTGASSGIGAAFAAELARRGAKVVLFARRVEKLTAMQLPGEILIVGGDVTRADDRAALVARTLQTFGRIDVLINNAGRGEGAADFLHHTPESIEAVMQTNLLSIIHLTHAVLPSMIAQQQGLIINVSSPMGQIDLPRRALYVTSKAGLTAFSHVLYRELQPQGIHVMDLRPGFTHSEMVTPKDTLRIPAIIPVLNAETVAKQALDAALKRKPDLMTGGLIVRLGVWLNRNLPRLGDRIMGRIR